MGFFDAFYFMSYTATTIGFGELPQAFNDAQRMWVTLSHLPDRRGLGLRDRARSWRCCRTAASARRWPLQQASAAGWRGYANRSG